jgi:hypothetical protein
MRPRTVPRVSSLRSTLVVDAMFTPDPAPAAAIGTSALELLEPLPVRPEKSQITSHSCLFCVTCAPFHRIFHTG